jgi:short-subunit dehydrogenase
LKAASKKFGKIDVLVNNAGYGEFGLFEAASEEQVITQFDVNVFG